MGRAAAVVIPSALLLAAACVFSPDAAPTRDAGSSCGESQGGSAEYLKCVCEPDPYYYGCPCEAGAHYYCEPCSFEVMCLQGTWGGPCECAIQDAGGRDAPDAGSDAAPGDAELATDAIVDRDVANVDAGDGAVDAPSE